MAEEAGATWRPDMLERFPMDSNAMVSDLDAERRHLLLTCAEQTTLSEELRRFLDKVQQRHPRYLRVKETFETLGAYKRIGQNIYERWREGQVERVYDLCAGHGLLGLLFAYRFPKLQVVCLDAEPRAAFAHYLQVADELGIDFSNVRYVECDIAHAPIEPRSYVVCIHACNELTRTALEKATAAGACYAVMPCCIRDGIYFRTVNHTDDPTRYAAAVGFIGGLYGAEKITAIDERITNRNLIVMGPAR